MTHKVTDFAGRCLLLLVAAFASYQAHAETAPAHGRFYVPEVPVNMASVDFYLLTAGIGDELANRFGHTGIRVHDNVAGTDVVFNWGKFSFDDPSFGWRFFRGSLVYSMGVRTYENDVRHYFEQNRLLIQDKLNLTLKQKRRLMEKIAWNAIPENRDFPYQYWYRNCSTIPRDYLDEVLEGNVRARYFNEPAGLVFRDYVRKNLGAIAFAVPTLDIFMNGNIDRPITMWEEMFLPMQLRERLAALPSVDDDGNPVAGTRLLIEKNVLVNRPESYESSVINAGLIAFLMWLPLIFSVVATFVVKPQMTNRQWIRRAAALGLMLWGAFAGTYGLILTLNWAFSGHPDGWANVNLMLLWPTDFIFAHAGWRLWRGRYSAPALQVYALTHVGSLVGLIGLASGGVITQDIWSVAGWWGPLMLAYCGVSATLGITALQAPDPTRSRLHLFLASLAPGEDRKLTQQQKR